MADDLPDWNLNILDPTDDDSKSRFIDVSKYDVDELIAQKENENTKKKAMYDLNIVLKFLREVRKEERELEKISPEELNVYLCEFIIAATILDKIKWNSKPPSPPLPPPPPPKSRMKPREGQKRAIFPSLIWGGGEVKVFHLFCPRL